VSTDDLIRRGTKTDCEQERRLGTVQEPIELHDYRLDCRICARRNPKQYSTDTSPSFNMDSSNRGNSSFITA
jgi:hypothetical protein